MHIHPHILEQLAAERRSELEAAAGKRSKRGGNRSTITERAASRPATGRGVARIADVMRREGPSVRPDTPLRDVAALLAEHQAPGIPVVGDSGQVVGIVTEDDILRREFMPASARRRRPGRRRGGDIAGKVAARVASEVMTAPVHTVRPSAPLAKGAKLFMECGTDILAVVDEADGTSLAGTVTRSDLVRFVARPDAEIAEDVERLLRRYWIRFEGLKISVARGQVLLRGSVDERAEAQMATRAAGRIPGVFAVESQLCWRRGA